MQFINTQIKAGIWQGDLVDAGDEVPDLCITHLGQALEDVTCERDNTHNIWRVSVSIPPAMISDGVQTFVVSDSGGSTLSTFSIIAGEPLADDLRAEISLLRNELDLLQTAFRRHCSEN